MENDGSSRLKKTGTREEVYKGLAMRTAGGLKRDDIIPKQFGTRVLYISKRLSDRMRENFNIIRASNPNHFKRQIKRTLGVSSQPNATNSVNPTTQVSTTESSILATNNTVSKPESRKRPASKTMKLAFKIDENVEKNVYYKELKGMDIKELKEELKREEAEEDLGIPQQPSNTNSTSNAKREFSIEEVPDIQLNDLF